MKKIIRWIKDERRIIYLEYGVLALAVLLPLLRPGFVLTLDMVFTPRLAFPAELGNTWPLEALLWLLNQVLPADVIQKAVLFVILVLSGSGMHRLVRTAAMHKLLVPAYLKWGAYAGGIFYMINPFTYSRFMAGQWQVLLGYALLPFFVLSLIKLIAKPGLKPALFAAIWASVVVMVSVHQTGMVALVAVVAAGLAIWRYWGRQQLKRLAVWGLASIGIVLALNSFWLVPTLLGNSTIAQSVNTFDTAHHEAFATDSTGPFGAIGNVIRLQGFWLEPRDMYLLPQAHMPVWGLVGMAVWSLVGIGAATGWRTQRFATLLMGITGLAGIILSATPLLHWLSDILPLVGGYREPHKFVTLVALAYAYFGALGAVRLMGWARIRWGETGTSSALVAVLLVPIAFTPTMVWGFGGQLTPRHYPADWHQMNEQLKAAEGEGSVLFLPWHQYMHFDFAGRIIANPAAKFFDRPTIVGDNPGLDDISPAYPDEQKQRISQALGTPSLAQALADEHIQFVILAKEYDYADYAYLDDMPQLRLVEETPNLKYYINEAYQP